ncbi:MAG: hypothetical protein WCE63_02375 [Acidobacteriaceae bacterium]
MTADCIAEMLRARPAGPNRWQARCPAHEDSSPSLSIAEGKDGRVLMRCWAGCATKDILSACGLTMRDLFAGPPATPQQAAMLAAEREAQSARQRQQRAISRAARNRVFQLESLVNAIGEKLARSPEDRELERLFHEVCQKWQVAETELYPVARELGGLRMEAPLTIPANVAAALSEIGGRFGEVKRPLYVAIERIA